MAKLLIEGVNGGRVAFPLVEPEILIGRMDSTDLVLAEPSVSRVHAKIIKETGGDVIVDLESRIGTRVNGESISRHRLVDGDIIQIASARLEYRE